MKAILSVMLLALCGAAWLNVKVTPLHTNIGSRVSGNYQFTATVIDENDRQAVVRNTESGEIIKLSLGSIRVSGAQGTATVALHGDKGASLIKWSELTESGPLLGIVESVRKDYAYIGGKSYRINCVDGWDLGNSLVGKKVYGFDTIDRVDKW